jgi:hypothetical protein
LTPSVSSDRLTATMSIRDLVANPTAFQYPVQITDSQQPVKATIRLYWPDTGGDFAIGPTSDAVLPIPADTKPVSVTVTAPGFLTWS